ncbi:hypothetical protein BDEG_27388 [Batrachochytrium dendrobatidis JEL423]|uniref:SAM-dependent MTase RsmB/NOP-type domain-containing protein n=1 Tax=Batrachochytrium dendrobatidis (strain JEL423) TaxID=403673 RepID=A0A177WVN6_BATDL|nr:hypothetical protein BDEG_27388 [Batrachochytrium dendrobatidis JEL423]
MGRRGGKRKHGSNRKAVSKDTENSGNHQDNRNADYVSYEVVMENKKFADYYKAQNIVSESDWDDFMAALKRPLPVSFRITGSRGDASDLREYMKKVHFPALQGFDIDGEVINPPNPIEWYPNQLAWQFDCSRTALRKSPKVKAFHSFLMSETNVGNISRQEVVSMIPVMFLDVKPSHYVLDMCAAPGSKTAQLLEAIHNVGENYDSETLADGLVVANDSNYERSQMLVHQAKRLQSPCLLVTNHDGQEFPRVFLTDRHSTEGATVLQFDRILCDVPCSGDGTMRKNKTIWRTWTHANGNGLHRLQKQILQRGCELLKIGALRLVDVSADLPQLTRRSGLTTWKVMDKSGVMFDTFDSENESHRTTLAPTFFPPKNVDELGLNNCMRVYPYMQNGGGFFVAVIEKIASIGTMDNYSIPKEERVSRSSEKVFLDSQTTTDTTTAETPAKSDELKAENTNEPILNENLKRPSNEEQSDSKRLNCEGKGVDRKGWFGVSESPFVFVESDSPLANKICDFYGMSPKFPKDLFVVRTAKDEEDFRSIYLVSSPIKKILMAKNAGKIKIVNTGVKVFKKNGGENFPTCPYRVSSEGIQTIAPFLSPARQITLSLADLCIFISFEYPKFTEFSKEAQAQFECLVVGSCLLRFNPADEKDYTGSITIPLVLPFFRSHVSGSLLIDKAERASLMHRLTGVMLTEFKPMDKSDRNDISC